MPGIEPEWLEPARVLRMVFRVLYREHAAHADEITSEFLRKADALNPVFKAADKVHDMLKLQAREGHVRLKDDVYGLIDLMECRRGEPDLFGEDDGSHGMFGRPEGSGGILTVVESRAIRVYSHVRFNRGHVVKLLERELAKKRIQPQLQAKLAEITATETSPALSSPAPTPPKPQRKPGSRGPMPGTASTYAKSDRKVFPAMKRLRRKGMTIWAAANELADKVKGSREKKSRAKRLAKRFREECEETDRNLLKLIPTNSIWLMDNTR